MNDSRALFQALLNAAVAGLAGFAAAEYLRPVKAVEPLVYYVGQDWRLHPITELNFVLPAKPNGPAPWRVGEGVRPTPEVTK